MKANYHLVCNKCGEPTGFIIAWDSDAEVMMDKVVKEAKTSVLCNECFALKGIDNALNETWFWGKKLPDEKGEEE